MNDKRKEYLKKWREDNKEHIKHYKKEYAKTHDSSFKKLQDKYKQLKENYERIYNENCKLRKTNEQLKDELKSKPDAQITLQDDKGNKFMIIQTERIDMQVELNKTIEKLFNNWNKLKKYINEANEDLYYTNNYDDILYIMQELEQGSDSNAKK